MNFEAFVKAVSTEWKSLPPERERKVHIATLQEESPLYFGTPDLGILSIYYHLTQNSYEANFKDIGGTPFNLTAVKMFDDWLHLSLIHVQTALQGGLPAQISFSDLEELRQFAALAFARSQRSADLFPFQETKYFVTSPIYKPVITSIGYSLVQRSLKGDSTVTRSYLIDYVYLATPREEQLEYLAAFHTSLGSSKEGKKAP